MKKMINGVVHTIQCGDIIHSGNEFGKAVIGATLTYTKNTEQGEQSTKINIEASTDGFFSKENLEDIIKEILFSLEH